MIKLFITGVAFALFVNPAAAQRQKTGPAMQERTIKLAESIKHIIVNGDADVVFIKETMNEITVEARQSLINSVSITNEKGTLTIESPGIYNSRRPLILVPASQLETLEVNGDGSVATAAMLQAKLLKVFVNGNCFIRIHSSGKVMVESSPDYHLYFKKP